MNTMTEKIVMLDALEFEHGERIRLEAEVVALRQRLAEAEAALRAVDEAFVSGDNAAMQGAIRQACAAAGMTAGEAGK